MLKDQNQQSVGPSVSVLADFIPLWYAAPSLFVQKLVKNVSFFVFFKKGPSFLKEQQTLLKQINTHLAL